jgi:hypothetical protein
MQLIRRTLVFATSPSSFEGCQYVRWQRQAHPPYQITNKGIQFNSETFAHNFDEDEYIVPLWGVTEGEFYGKSAGVYTFRR